MKPEKERVDWTLGPRCNGVVLHEDPATQLRAMKLWSQIEDDIGTEVKCDVTLWPADLFEIPPLRERVFREVDQTNVVTISVHDPARLPPDAIKWLTQWLNTKSSLPRALIILHDGDEENEVVRFMRTLAEFVGVSVFIRRSGGAGNGSDATGMQHDHQRGESLAFAP